MKQTNKSVVRWMGMTALALAVTACGGGGGDGGAAVPDIRNGTYTVVAADANEYTLSLNFDAHTYRMAGGSLDQSGSFAQDGSDFTFQPGNATGTAGFNTMRFTLATDTVVGEFAFPHGTVPFVAPRTFVSTIAGAAGVYNFLSRRVDATTGAGTDTTVQQGEITADGNLRTCDDNVIFTIANCPSGSVTTSPITVSGDVFTATVTGQGTFTFHVAQVGSDKIFLRASASANNTRRFMLGTPATGTFAAGTFEGGTTEPAWGTITLGGSTFASSGTSPAGVTTTQAGTFGPSGVADIGGITTTDAGNFFAVRSSEIGIVVAARSNTAATGFTAIGKAQ